MEFPRLLVLLFQGDLEGFLIFLWGFEGLEGLTMVVEARLYPRATASSLRFRLSFFLHGFL